MERKAGFSYHFNGQAQRKTVFLYALLTGGEALCS
jgi:hypothetical protein